MFGKGKKTGKISTAADVIGAIGQVTLRPFVSCKEDPEAGKPAMLAINEDQVIRTSTVQKALSDGNGHWVVMTRNSIYINF